QSESKCAQDQVRSGGINGKRREARRVCKKNRKELFLCGNDPSQHTNQSGHEHHCPANRGTDMASWTACILQQDMTDSGEGKAKMPEYIEPSSSLRSGSKEPGWTECAWKGENL